MHALSGDFGARAAGALAAGCDLALHCSGDMAEMVSIASAIGDMDARSRVRLDRAMATIRDGIGEASYEELAAKRDSLLAYA
jgi:beta-N-acetylhexosaminidase